MEAIYTRQSVDRKDSISIESQIEFCKRELVTDCFSVYTDRGYSGKDTNRPAFERLLVDVKNGKIAKVIVYKLDRMSRSLLDFAKIIDVFNEYGIEFMSCTEKFDTGSPIGKAMLSIIMVFAQLERETIQKRVTDNYYERGRQGMYIGGRAPYGFQKVETVLNGKKTYTFAPNPEQIETLKEIYNLYTEPNISLGAISRFLNQNGIPAAQGGSWDACKLSRIMHNPVYVRADADVYLYYKNKGCIMSNEIEDFTGVNGCYLYGKRKASDRKYANIENHVLSLALHEGAIDAKTFLHCQNKLSGNKKIANTGKSKYSWLSGKLRCGYCGSAITTTTQYKGVPYLGCTGKKLRQDCGGTQRPLKAPDIEAVIEKQILLFCNCQSRIPKSRHRQARRNQDTATQIKIIDQKIDNLLEQVAIGSAAAGKYINEKIDFLESEKKRLLEASSHAAPDSANDPETFQLISIAASWSGLSLDEKKAVAGQLVEAVTVTGDSLAITWKKPFDTL